MHPVVVSSLVLLLAGLATSASIPDSVQVHSSNIFDIIAEVGGIEGLKKVFDAFSGGKVDNHTCMVCEALLKFLQDYLRSGKSAHSLAKILEAGCVLSRMVSPKVCKGAIEKYKDEVMFIIANSTTPLSEACILLLGSECGPLTSDLHNWTVSLLNTPKPEVKSFPKPEKKRPLLRVLHLSDTHYDPEYKEGSLAKCQDPLCCQERSGLPENAEDAAGMWGDHRSCDLPIRTLESLLQHVRDNHKIDYIIWTGDLPPHEVWKVTRNDNIENFKTTAGLIRKYFPSVPVYPAVGNHEAVPCDSFPVQEIGSFSSAWLYNALVDVWSQWLPESTFDTIRRGGFYSTKVKPDLKIISLNNIYCYHMNWWVAFNSTDPQGQLAWLVEELDKSETACEKVHIIGHIPPGNKGCIQVWSENFHKIITRYESTVVAQFYGHTHKDELEVFYDREDLSRATSIAYISPSVTTFTGYNPSYRIYSVDGEYVNTSHTVLDHETYILNLTESILKKEASWYLEYTAAETYEMESLSPQEWDKLITRFETDDALFQKFYRFYQRKAVGGVSPCDSNCKKNMLCTMRTAISRNHLKC